MTKEKKSPQQKLARRIQAATGKAYLRALNEAETLLADGATECGDRLTDWVCDLAPGPHPGWQHFDGGNQMWWSQSREFPYGNAAALSQASEQVSPQTAVRIPRQILRRMNQGKDHG